MSKKRKKSSAQKDKFFSKKSLALFLLAFALPLIAIYGVSYLNLFEEKKSEQKIDSSTQKLMDKMKKMLDEEKNRLADKDQNGSPTVTLYPKLPPIEDKVKIVEEKKEEDHFSEINDYKKSLETTPKESETKVTTPKEYKTSGKPKLAIIIDDVSYEHQVKMLQKIPYKVTPSFFPPTPRHPDTVRLAKRFEFAMVHLPMEALSYSRPEPSTLNVGDSVEKIDQRIVELKALFPHIKYYNNHTGSKFTADYDSMDKFFQVAQKEGIFFVDSRTTSQTKVGDVANKYGINLFSRDVFLDNDTDKKAIAEQLKKAVKLAKKHGFAIAIGHPHDNTLTVLKDAKNILKDVEPVFVKEL